MKIYTKKGDDGTTGLLDGQRVSKSDPRLEVCGTLDEMNSVLGVARASTPAAAVDALLERLQNQLFQLGAALAAPAGLSFDAAETAWLETQIDAMTEQIPPLAHFILPGGTAAAAQIHLARAICRRAERTLVLLGQRESVAAEILAYVNRLSDFLFTLGRFENFLQNAPETKWNVKSL